MTMLKDIELDSKTVFRPYALETAQNLLEKIERLENIADESGLRTNGRLFDTELDLFLSNLNKIVANFPEEIPEDLYIRGWKVIESATCYLYKTENSNAGKLFEKYVKYLRHYRKLREIWEEVREENINLTPQ